MLCIVLSGYVLFLLLAVSSGYPLGVPDTACFWGTPSHGTAPQSSDSPYQIELDPSDRLFFKPDEEVKVTISIKWGSSDFKGFLLQAKTVATNGSRSQMVGTFRIHTNYLKTNKLVCEKDGHNAVSHSAVTKFWRVSAFWTPPVDFKGEVIFKAVVVKSYNTFWVNIKSAPLRPFPDPTPSPTSASTAAVPSVCHHSQLEDFPEQLPHMAFLCQSESDCPCGWKCCPLDENCNKYAICRKPKQFSAEEEEEREDDGAVDAEVDPSSFELDECC